MSIIAFPKGILGAFFVKALPYNTRVKAPPKPKIIPMNFNEVIFSFKNSQESNITMIGIMVMITELLIGVERLNPRIKKTIFKHIPKAVAAKILR